MKRFKKIILGDKNSRNSSTDAHVDVSPCHSSVTENQKDPATRRATATITLIELSGVKDEKLKGRKTHEHSTKGENESAASTANVVVWCHQNDSEDSANNPSSTRLPSCPLAEESMDDEGRVFSWGCMWPDVARSLHITLPMTYENQKNIVIPLRLGLQLPGQDEIKLFGGATITITAQNLLSTKEGLSVPVNPLKEKTSLSSRIGIGFRKMRSEYSISPSAVLKLILKMECSKMAMPDQVKQAHSLSEKERSGVDTYVSAASAISTSEPQIELVQLLINNSELKDSSLSVEGSKTVKAANIARHSDASEGFTIESEDSVLDGSLAKQEAVVVTIGKECKIHPADITYLPGHPDPHLSNQKKSGTAHQVEISTEESLHSNITIANDHEVEQSKWEQRQFQPEESPEHEPLLAVVELDETISDVSGDLTMETFDESPKAKPAPNSEDSKPAKPDKQEHQPVRKLAGCIKCSEVNGLEEVVEDTVEGLADIVTCNIFMEDMFCDDKTCRTDCTSLETYDTTLSSYQPTLQSDTITAGDVSTETTSVKSGSTAIVTGTEMGTEVVKYGQGKTTAPLAWAGHTVMARCRGATEKDGESDECSSDGSVALPDENDMKSELDFERSWSVYSV